MRSPAPRAADQWSVSGTPRLAMSTLHTMAPLWAWVELSTAAARDRYMDSTDARRAFQALTAAVPHSSSSASPISSSATDAGGRPSPIRSAVSPTPIP